jgi:hypothetical protein
MGKLGNWATDKDGAKRKSHEMASIRFLADRNRENLLENGEKTGETARTKEFQRLA